jgi:asparagine synthase (glutamine-hydrolysing)
LWVEPGGSTRSFCYWRLELSHNEEDERLSLDEWADRLRPALLTAVERELAADVDVGVFLSGGLDSSLIVALLAEFGKNDIHTFSIGFGNSPEQEGNEFQYSDLISKTFGTRHEKIFIDSHHLISSLPDAIKAMSEPMVSRDCVGFYELSRHASASIKVVQCGQGADEMFAGYDFYGKFSGAAHAERLYASDIVDFDADRIGRALSARWQAGAGASFSRLSEEMARSGATDPVDKAIYFHGAVKLAEDQLKRVDDMTMAWGIEARVPFLDHELTELSARIPSRHKIVDGGKGVLKRLARHYLPAEIIDRPKGYFPVPEVQYPQGPVLAMIRDAFSSRAAIDRGLFERQYLDELFAAPTKHHVRSGAAELWYCASLELWLQAQGI